MQHHLHCRRREVEQQSRCQQDGAGGLVESGTLDATLKAADILAEFLDNSNRIPNPRAAPGYSACHVKHGGIGSIPAQLKSLFIGPGWQFRVEFFPGAGNNPSR
jgi:hypothetical protein